MPSSTGQPARSCPTGAQSSRQRSQDEPDEGPDDDGRPRVASVNPCRGGLGNYAAALRLRRLREQLLRREQVLGHIGALLLQDEQQVREREAGLGRGRGVHRRSRPVNRLLDGGEPVALCLDTGIEVGDLRVRIARDLLDDRVREQVGGALDLLPVLADRQSDEGNGYLLGA